MTSVGCSVQLHSFSQLKSNFALHCKLIKYTRQWHAADKMATCRQFVTTLRTCRVTDDNDHMQVTVDTLEICVCFLTQPLLLLVCRQCAQSCCVAYSHLCHVEAHVGFLQALGGLGGEQAVQLPPLAVLHQEVQMGAGLYGAIKRCNKGMVHCIHKFKRSAGSMNIHKWTCSIVPFCTASIA